MELSALVDAYVDGIRTVRQSVAGMTPTQAAARPVPGKWSTLEVVCHLADFEAIYADRIKRVLSEDNPTLMSADEQRYAACLAYQNRDLGEELALIENVRKQLARILLSAPPDALKREGVFRHEGKDEKRTVESFLTSITNHIPHHVKFIHDKRAALGLPK
jgi:hypothetical protein